MKTTEEFVRSAAEWISSAIVEIASKQDIVRIGISGGSTPKPIYALLAADQHVPWKKTSFFLLDERYVSSDHVDSNQQMIRETLLTRAGGEATLLAPETSLPLDACVGAYEKQLQGIKPDLVIIGMGDDGHIASLFPPLPPEVFGPTNVIHTTTDTFAVRDRISVTLPLLVSSKRRLFLITGPKKAALLQTMQQASEDVSLYPAQYFFDERSTWFVGP